MPAAGPESYLKEKTALSDLRGLLSGLLACLAGLTAAASGVEESAAEGVAGTGEAVAADGRPNVLIAISDDVSWPHASAYGSRMVSTPVFDRVAREGVLFQNAFCPAPGCSPSRAAFLTGRSIWMIEAAGTHASYFPARYRTFPERLQEAGYFVGSTGKAWAPGDFRHDGRTDNPAGRRRGMRRDDYVDGFRQFLQERPTNRPFCFWFGSHDAHRPFERGIGERNGRSPNEAEVPPFLPDHPVVRSDLLDYAFEIERFDRHLGEILQILEATGELNRTLIIVTSDNGMGFPRAKANCYEFGIHMPLAVCWKDAIPPGRVLTDLVDFTDLAATICDAAGVQPASDDPPMSGRSLLEALKSDQEGLVDSSRTAVFVGRERHSSSRFHSLGYPQRAIRTPEWLFIMNLRPERWPAGAPRKYSQVVFRADGTPLGQLGPMHGGYHDIDACPTLDFLIEHRNDPVIGRFLKLAVDRRPAEELFDIRSDPGCLNNLADDPDYADVVADLRKRLTDHLRRTGDPRMTDQGDVWETYPRVSRLRWFETPDWARKHPERVPYQEWLERRRPRAPEGSAH